MVRQTYRTNPAQKHLEVFQNFSGGLNSMADRSILADHEVSDLVNMDIVSRGTLRRRNGHAMHLEAAGAGMAQGYFRLYLDDGEVHELVAQGGKLYRDGQELIIEGLEDGFQTERKIEAVQYRKTLYIATGTELVSYDGEVSKVVEAYMPDPLEALYVGTNGLAENPDDYMKDGEAIYLRLDGLTFSSRYGVINEPTTLRAFVSKPSGSTIEFQFQQKLETDMLGDWKTFRDWSTDRSADFVATDAGDYQFRVFARIQGSVIGTVKHFKDIAAKYPNPKVDDLVYIEESSADSFYRWTGQEWKHENGMQYLVPKYVIKPAKDEEDEHVPVEHMRDCNRILLYWDRLILYGDETQPDAIYISHLNNPAYFPVPNSLRFENVEQEGITAIQRHRDVLIAFTPSSIQALYGTSPLDFQRIVLQTGIGCIAPYGTAVIDNHVAFLSNEGIYVLKMLGYTENRANVEKIDSTVDNLIARDKDVVLLANGNQLHVYMPNHDRRLRYYYNQGRVWTKDESEIFNVTNVYEFNGEINMMLSDGRVVVPSETYDDVGYAYYDEVETKDYTFYQPHHIKKLKELQLSMGGTGDLYVTIYADDTVILDAKDAYASVDEEGFVQWEEVDKITFPRSATVLGEWEIGKSTLGFPERIGKINISGKCTRTRVRISHRSVEPNEFIGMAYVFKLKKP